ncbi:MAG TPA: group 1 truncated hemoglobin [Kofleriaceae bacterium]|jgi:hemoglobin|nr:group 1 truncated hemoglobin [Kofleriaceae bacterium]
MRKALLIVLLAACGGSQSGGSTTTTTSGSGAGSGTLFTSLGGEPAIKAVVKDFVEEEVAKDDRINAFFKNTDIPSFEQKLYEQICAAAGGGCTYTGKDMKTAHAGMNVKESDFNALVEDLVKSLDKFHVKDADKQTLLGVLGPMKSDIVTAQ